jgi:MFS transporter, YNFM family, putative membrane transport protein
MSSIERNMRVLAFGGFVSGLTLRMAEPMLPRVAEDFGVPVADAAVVLTGFALAYGLFQLAHGRISDRIGVLRTVAVAMALACVVTAACAFVSSLNELAVMRFATGMFAGAIIPLSFAYVGDHVPIEDRQPVLGRFIVGILLGQMLGPLIGGLFSDFVGWRASFLVPAVAFALTSMALVGPALTDRRAPRPEATAGFLAAYRSLLGIPKVRAICAAVAVEGFLFYGAFAFMGAYLRTTFDATYTVIGIVLAAFGLGGAAYSASVRMLVSRLGIKRMVTAAGALLGLALASISLMPTLLHVAALIAVIGFAFLALHNTLQTRATEMAPQARGSAIALFAFSLFIGQALGVECFALLIEAGNYTTVFRICAAGLACTAFWLATRLKHL